MRCSKVNKKLNAYLDHELDQFSQEGISTHLLTCKKCQKELFLLKQTNNLLDTVFDIQVNEHIVNSLIEKSKFINTKRSFLTQTRLRNSALAIFAMLTGAYLSFTSFDNSNITTQTTSVYETESLYTYVYEVGK